MARPPSRRGAPRFNRFIALLMVALGLWSGGLFRFADALPATLGQPDRTSDAIVVLTGGSGRLDEGLRLLHEGRAKTLFISGVYKGTDIKSLLEAYRQQPDLDCCVAIGYAEDTIDNALETAQWAKSNAVTSLHLVTSAYHMPRAVLEFRNAMPGVTVHPHPVFTANVKQEDWWAWPGTSALIVGEYNKFLLAWTRHRLMGLLK